MLWSSIPIAIIVVLSVLLAAMSAVAGALGWRLRLARTLPRAESVEALSRRLEELEKQVKAGWVERVPHHPVGPRRSVRIDRGSAVRRKPTLIAVPDLSAAPAAGTEPARTLRQRYQEIWSQADAGLDAEAIARQAGQPIGQVELILSLRRFDPEMAGQPTTSG